MKSSVEISMYPLDADYGTAILQFIHRLREHPGLVVQSNTMSTQIFGEFDQLMAALTQEIKTSFEEDQAVVTVLKIANLDLRGN